VIPIVDLVAMGVGLVALFLGRPFIVLASWGVVLSLIGLRAVLVLRRLERPGLTDLARAVAFAAVFDIAKALALLARGSHGARRSK
jgi:hypothetical protein